MKSSPTQIIKWLRTRKQGSSLPNREKAADLIEELQAAVIASQSRIAELEQANNREILDSSNHVRDATKMVTDRQLADVVNELRAITAAADAVIQRWHTPLWKDARPTAEYIAVLRRAAESAHKLLVGGVE
jgi:predicted RNA-binding Zn ribbon-like protein